MPPIHLHLRCIFALHDTTGDVSQMIRPEFATIIIIAFILIFGVGIPVLNVKAKKFISYRWCVVVVALALLIGAVVDFDVLSDETRRTVILGGLIIGCLYVVLRTAEKVLSKGWLKGTRVKAKKGDAEIELSSDEEARP